MTTAKTCFTAGIVKGLKEHNDPLRHFGSLLGSHHHIKVAEECGLVVVLSSQPLKLRLTQEGEAYYEEQRLKEMPDSRAYFWVPFKKTVYNKAWD